MSLLILAETAPPKKLINFVEIFWTSRIKQNGSLLLVPTINTELIAYRVKHGSGFTLVGPMTTAQRTQVFSEDTCVGVRLKAGTKSLLQDQNFATLRNSKINASDMTSLDVQNFTAKITNLSNPEDIQAELIALIVKLVDKNILVRDTLVDQFIKQVEAHNGQVKTADLLQQIPLSDRQFRRRFVDFTGVSPKEFISICRQRSALDDYHDTAPTITKIAAEHGYTDQAHFTHELQKRVGTTPLAFKSELSIKQ